MKTITLLIMNVLLTGLLLTASGINAKATGIEPGDSVTTKSSFDVGLFMGPQWRLNLMLVIHRPGWVSITVKDARNTVLYRELVKKAPTRYRRKFNFEGSEPGVYRLEISDGRNTIVRQVEIVDIPAIDAQRYIVYGPQTTH